jgi:pyridoxine 5'-phosphate synthase
MTRLSVNINKVATLRNTRAIGIPSITHAARLCLQAGAQGITVHPRPDQRHIRPGDVTELAELLKDWPRAEFNIEGNPFIQYMEIIRRRRPAQCTLVPDATSAPTSDHGWDLPRDAERLRPIVRELHDLGCRVSLFMDADPQAMEEAAKLGVDRIELYTEPYAGEFARKNPRAAHSRRNDGDGYAFPRRKGRTSERLREQVEFQIANGNRRTRARRHHRRIADAGFQGTRAGDRTDRAIRRRAGAGDRRHRRQRDDRGDRTAQIAKKAGAPGCLSVNPYYNKPTQEGLYRHFMTLADRVDLPIVLYNIPGRTGVTMSPQTVARLAKHRNIVAIKEATGDLNIAGEIRRCATSPSSAATIR